MSEAIPEQFKHFEVQRRDDGSLWELGRGAMGVTYKAFDTQLRCPVALKVINAQYLHDPVARERFLREARAAALLRHPNVAAIFHLETDEDSYFYAMEYIDGETVAERVKREGPLLPAVALDITDQVARALSAASRENLIHRDIKPANLMLVKDDHDLVVKVIDFGLAKSITKGPESSATMTMGEFVGTPSFASPEQLDEQDLDIRSDIYSLGVTLWFMLIGRPPFEGSLVSVASSHLSKPPPFKDLTGLPDYVVSLLEKMLQKDRQYRPQTPAELRRELARCSIQDKATEVETPSPASPSASVIHPPLENQLGGRFNLLQKLTTESRGNFHEATDCETGEKVLVQTFGTRAEASLIAPIAASIMANPHQNLIRPIMVSVEAKPRFVAMENVHGISLLDLLKKRRKLSLEEVLILQEQTAAGIDHALEIGLTGLRLGLEDVQIKLNSSTTETIHRELLGSNLKEWPPFLLKLDPFGETSDVDAATMMGNMTMMPSLQPAKYSPEASAALGIRYVQALAAGTYKLLGGIRPPTAGEASRYVPESSLSEAGNRVLKRALLEANEQPFASATDFVTCLGSTVATGHESKFRTLHAGNADRTQTSGNAPTETSIPGNRNQQEGSIDQPVGGKNTLRFWLAGTSILVLAGAAFYFQGLRSEPEIKPPRTVTSFPASSPLPTDVQPPEPVSVEPIPTLEPDPLLVLVNKIKNGNQDTAQYVSDCVTYLRHVQKNPPSTELDPVTLRRDLETLLEAFRVKQAPMKPSLSKKFFAPYALAINDAAQMDILPAILILADNEEAQTAFNWYYYAAVEKQSAYAMMKLARSYAKGAGSLTGEKNFNEAFSWFERATKAGDKTAAAYLGECYLFGHGTEKNQEKAVEILTDAVKEEVGPAECLLGMCHMSGWGGLEKKFTRMQRQQFAINLFTDASLHGDSNGYGLLGQLYEIGLVDEEGKQLPPDLNKAEEVYRKGVENENPLCWFRSGRLLYQQAANGPEGSLQKRRAVELINLAANAEFPLAQKWKSEHPEDFKETHEEGSTP